MKYDCKTGEVQKGFWWETECGGRDSIPEDKGITYTGPVSFTIKMRNELMGGDVTLFTGKAKVAKVHSGEAGHQRGRAQHHSYCQRTIYLDADEV